MGVFLFFPPTALQCTVGYFGQFLSPHCIPFPPLFFFFQVWQLGFLLKVQLFPFFFFFSKYPPTPHSLLYLFQNPLISSSRVSSKPRCFFLTWVEVAFRPQGSFITYGHFPKFFFFFPFYLPSDPCTWFYPSFLLLSSIGKAIICRSWKKPVLILPLPPTASADAENEKLEGLFCPLVLCAVGSLVRFFLSFSFVGT